jgi:hypothetical protein
LRNVVITVCMVLILGVLSGCAVHMAATASSRKDIGALSVGTHRELLLAEFGNPVVERVDDNGLKYDIFKFTKGFTGGEKFFHAAGHGLMDVATLGLWELVGTPSESMSQDNEITVKVKYDKDDMVTTVIPLKDKWNELKK